MGHSYTFGDKLNFFEGISSLLDRISKLRDLRGKSGLFWDFSGTLVPIGTKSRNWDLLAATGFPLSKMFPTFELVPPKISKCQVVTTMLGFKDDN